MGCEQLRIHARPRLGDAKMLLGLSGWMDGGDVSTGTIHYLAEQLDAKRLAEIDPEDFYIYNFPGSMEISSLFRPHTKIEDGVVTAYEPPRNVFYFDDRNNLVLFEGKEPNIRWADYAECVFEAASLANVSSIYFIGSVGGLVPHTREPRIFSTVSHPRLKGPLGPHVTSFSNYEGPGSIITHFLFAAEEKGFDMATLVAEVPPYVQGRNFKCIEAMMRKLGALLEIPIRLDEMRPLSDELERRISEIIEEKPELADHIRKLEEDYDNEVFDTQMGDLKTWLEQQGIRLD